MNTRVKIDMTAPDRWVDMSGVPADPAVAERCRVSLIQAALTDLGAAKVVSASVNRTGGFQPPKPPWMMALDASMAGLTASQLPEVTGLPDFCDVRVEYTGAGGRVAEIAVWVPLAWNGRLGIANGWLPLWGDLPFSRPLTMPAALRNGFVTATTDSGNRDPRLFGWAFDETTGDLDHDFIRSWGYSAVHDMVVVAKAVTRALHGSPPEYSYMAATSLGGKQVLETAQRYPEDFDGFWAIDPGVSWTKAIPAGMWPALVMKEYDTILPPAKLEAFRAGAVAACDGADGLDDGFLGAFEDCLFEPRILIGESTEAGEITERDAEVMTLIWDGPRRHDGERLWFGIRPGVDFWSGYGLAMSPDFPGQLVPELSVDHFRWVTGDQKFDWRTLTFQSFEELFDRGVREWADIATDNPDLTRLRDRGAKLVISHSGDDGALPAEASVDYYQRVAGIVGGVDKAADFARLFVADGDIHSFSLGRGPGLTLAAGMAALMEWVENDNPPELLVAERRDPATGVVQATRPVHRYPTVTLYRGDGDPNDADSYVGAQP
ncbi:tannase/feruloyl esterase family alpha/beta hydrolase [Streptomyces chartreusis]|uniref:tannase/feruloyl esterase family alpha/beta hydrolase n=1 Tax=Streptomyces chartreusis TaxID=1969 RepID=UPI00363308A7